MMREEDLLASFLIDSEFQDTVSFAQFVRMFPAKYQSHPDLKDLYRAYLGSRSRVRGLVRDNIAQQALQSEAELALQREQESQRMQQRLEQRRTNNMQRSTAAAATESDGLANDIVGVDYDFDMEIEGTEKHLTLSQAIEELLLAQSVFESEVTRMEHECQAYAEDIQRIDKELEDVKVPLAPFKNHQEEELFENLEELIRLCDAITGPPAQSA